MIRMRAGARLGVAALFLFGANDALQTAVAEGDTRTISFHHLHTDEDITITYKREGRYNDAALKKLDWFMRDWRRDQSVHMNPRLFDLLWETNREVGGTQPIQLVSGFRSPETNSMLRARSSGVAQFSQHTQGHAIDFFIPGVPLEKIRAVGLRLQRGGVGFYPSSGSPFVHLDTGTIRHWPRMTHEQLAKVFPDGRTVHIPSDGQPLPRFALALADVERRGDVPSETSLAAARESGIVTASIERDAAKSSADKSSGDSPKRGLLARIFGVPKDADELNEEPAPKSASKAASTRAGAATSVASLSPPKHAAIERAVPMPTARPKPAGPTVAAAALPGNVFDNRGYWRGAGETGPDLAPPAQTPFEVASADSSADLGATGSTAKSALAYAAESETPASPARARPMGSGMPRLPAAAAVMPALSNTTVAVKAPLAPAFAGNLSSGGQRVDSPWLRAAILTPSVSDFMTATRLGAVDPRSLHDLLLKPSQALVMTFSADPHQGTVTDRFNGRAVVFLATATFTARTTASLR